MYICFEHQLYILFISLCISVYILLSVFSNVPVLIVLAPKAEPVTAVHMVDDMQSV